MMHKNEVVDNENNHFCSWKCLSLANNTYQRWIDRDEKDMCCDMCGKKLFDGHKFGQLIVWDDGAYCSLGCFGKL
jgi:hypothetical protein